MKKTQAFVPDQLAPGDKIIIYGAGVYGEIAHAALQEMGLRPDIYCDDSYTDASGLCRGVPVIRSSELPLHVNDTVILASYNYYDEMLGKCREAGCQKVFDMEEMLKLPLQDKQLSGRAMGRLHDQDGYRKMLERITKTEQIRVNHVEFVVCEHCTLKCRDCANLISSYKKPGMLEAPEYFDAMDRLMDSLDYVGKIYLIGGEPFLHPKLGGIIDRFAGYENCGGMVIFSNGTLVPDEYTIKMIEEHDVALQISDYHLPCQKIGEIQRLFDKLGISYVIKEYCEWISLGGFSPRDRSGQKAQQAYTGCFFRKQYTLHRGRLFNCPRTAHAFSLGLLEKADCEYMDFNGQAALPSKGELKKFIEQTTPRTACRFCDGGNLSGKTISAAIQMEDWECA